MSAPVPSSSSEPVITKVTTLFSWYDREEIIENCTVQILTNSKTGEVSIGWWRNDTPPVEVSDE